LYELRNTSLKTEYRLEAFDALMMALISLEKLNLESTLKFYTEAPDNMSKKEIKLKIDSYITQIDQCIKLLENN
jgi:hypothetical protein